MTGGWLRDVRKQLLMSVFLIASVIFIGTAGYMLIEGWNFLDALYMTVITITTIGFKEVHLMSDGGRLFTIFLVFTSVGAVFFALNHMARIIIEGEIQSIFGRKKLQKRIERLKDHYVVCGYGRMGKIVCREFESRRAAFVVIEKSAEQVPGTAIFPEGMLIMTGDATKDETLLKAGIERARGLITVLPTDAENLYVVLSARGINPGLQIVARAVEDGAEQKLMRAGANRTVSPYHIGGLRIAHTLLKPTVVDFIEFTTSPSGDVSLDMEEILVGAGSALEGKTLSESGIGRELEMIVVAIKKKDGDMKVNPTHKSKIHAGDTLVVIGAPAKMKVLEGMAGATREAAP
jgi:voltage-gated potassium channel